jgi:nucleotide-binding universal stress UspA family protein
VIARILVALDASPRAPRVFAVAAELARRFGAPLVPLRAVFIHPEFPPAAAGIPRDELADHVKSVASDELESILRADACAGVTLESPVVRVGLPWRVILDTSVELDVDLIVLGSHGYSMIDRVLGTTAATVTNLADCNVFVVRDRAKRGTPPSR